ncbi:MAG: GtrA family protein [Christensenellales bacterium]|jgi:putative flippase GtrA
MDKLKSIYIKVKNLAFSETGLYIIFGALTTLVNFVVFQVGILAGIDYLYANVLAWFISVLFAFVVNKIWVFKSRSFAAKVIIKESISFMAARLFSLGIDEVGMWLLVEKVAVDMTAAKIIMNVVVIAVNYVLSKFIIFKKPDEKQS